MLTNEQIAEILDQVADHIDANGWLPFLPAQNTPPYLTGRGPGAMSVLGAVQYLITGSPARWDTSHGDPRVDDVDQVMHYLDARIIRLFPDDLVAESVEPFMSWHSESSFTSGDRLRTTTEVLAFVRAAATELHTPGTGDGADAGGWVCPECGEDVRQVPPDRLTPGCPPQKFSHLDGEPLCPVIGDAGYCPASPVRKDNTDGCAR